MTHEEIGERIWWMLADTEAFPCNKEGKYAAYEVRDGWRCGVLGEYCDGSSIGNGITLPCLQAILDRLFGGEDAEEIVNSSDRLHVNGCNTAQHPIIGVRDWTHGSLYSTCKEYRHKFDKTEKDAIMGGRFWLDVEDQEYVEDDKVLEELLGYAARSLKSYKEMFCEE